MSQPPAEPKIYHITHVDNLASLAAEGMLLSDAAMIERGGPVQAIGMSTIKRRRVEELYVGAQPGTKVGDYVPFYFCPRSVMLYVIFRANHPELTYRDGQEPIVHLEADLRRVIQWADENGVRWAFSLSNAGSRYAEFRSNLSDLNELNWNAIAATDFRPSDVKEGKQAEFLVQQSFPFFLFECVGVQSAKTQVRAMQALRGASHRLPVEVRREWYF